MSAGRRARMAALAATAVLVSVACGGGDPDAGAPAAGAEPQRGGSLVLARATDAQTLDPPRCATLSSWGQCQAVFGTLLGLDPETAEIGPGMAESFTSEDGVHWTLTLRESLTFTDGTPFDADAVTFNWDRITDPVNLSPGLQIATGMVYEAVDPRTVEITLDAVNWTMPWALYGELAFIGSPTAIAEHGPEFGNSPVGAGPFRFESWARGTRMILTRNESYWDQPRPHLDRIEFATIGADDQRLNALRAGDIDVMVTVSQEYADRATAEGFLAHSTPALSGQGVSVSHTRGALAAPEVREAVARLVDSAQINDAVYGGAVTETFAEPGSILHDPQARYPGVDVARAQQLIDGYLARTGENAVVLTYKLLAGVPQQARVAELLQAQLQRVRGLRLEIEQTDAAAFFADRQSGNYQLMLMAVQETNPDQLHRYFHTDGGQNSTGYSDPATDAALDRARATEAPAARIDAYREATRHIAANFGLVPWTYQQTHLLSDESVGGVEPNYSYFLRSEAAWKQD